MKANTDTSFKFTVLLVDDHDAYRKELAEYLRGDGFDVIDTSLTSTACAMIRKGRVSLVLLDWNLQNHHFDPGEPSTGLKILQTCHEVDPLLPVIAMSDSELYNCRDDSLLAGADCFLKKPFAQLSLSVLLHRWNARLKAEKNPFTQLTAGVIKPVDAVKGAYTRAVVEKIGSALKAAPKLGLSRQTIASYLASH
jgi:DNA-binding response OmpR family regulator